MAMQLAGLVFKSTLFLLFTVLSTGSACDGLCIAFRAHVLKRAHRPLNRSRARAIASNEEHCNRIVNENCSNASRQLVSVAIVSTGTSRSNNFQQFNVLHV